MSWISRLFGGAAPTIRVLDDGWGDITTDDLYAIPTVVACRQILADVASSFSLVQEDRDGNPTNRVPMILEQPSAWEPLPDFIERMVNDMTRHGRAWIEVTARDGFDNPLAADLVSPRRVTVTLTQDNQHIARVRVDSRDVDLRDIIQVPMLLDDGPLGQAPLEQARPQLENLLYALQFAGDLFNRGTTTPNYALVSSTRLPPATADALMQSWQEARAQSRPALLSGDLSLETFSGQTAAEVQLSKHLEMLDITIARIFNVPPSVVNVIANGSLTYSTTNSEMRRLLIFESVSILKRIETAMTQLLPSGRFAKFNTANLTRLDETETLTNAITAYQAGLISREEARLAIGRDPDAPEEQATLTPAPAEELSPWLT